GPNNVVIAGDHHTTLQIAAHFQAQGRHTHRLKVSHAFHSPHMDPILNDLQTIAHTLTHHPPHTPLISTLNPGHNPHTPDHWPQHARHPVRYADAITHLHHHGVTTYLDLGPNTTLATLTTLTLTHLTPHDHPTPAVLPLTRPHQPEPTTLLTALSHAYTRGTPLTWNHPHQPTTPQPPINLPTYPFQQQRFWLDKAATPQDAAGLGLEPTVHPLLSTATQLPDGTHLFTGRLSLETHPWLADHSVANTTLLPATALLELALHAAERTGCEEVEELVIHTPLALEPQQDLLLHLTAGPADVTGRHAVAIHSRTEDGQPWMQHASGVLVRSS
ncbi:acyltransferase domain-containing protein, partial [Nonomuraea sp. NPDC048916]|uniref:acyltransferase domain-containing protein n=1 Tax=Nonomuraea sp. NPDC048916 TaxID=3154232 RepID=UPI003406AD2F